MWSVAALESAANSFRRVVNAIVYAEVSVRYSRIEDLEAALPKGMIEREATPFAAGFLAGKVFPAYRDAEEPNVHRFGFFIGAHAAVAGHRLRTRDAARYRSYFPGLRMIAPE